jgi:hypothetical protein
LHTDVASQRLLGPNSIKVRPKVLLPQLGLQSAESWILHVGDGLLLKAYLSIYGTHPALHPWGEVQQEFCSVFGDSELLHCVLTSTHDALSALASPNWSRKRPLAETQSLIRIATNEVVTSDHLPSPQPRNRRGVLEPWHLSEGSWRPAPCRHCGSAVRVRLAIDEPDGYMCLECRRTPNGLVWPARFDRFIAYPEMWVAAGWKLDVPSKPTEPTPKRVITNRRQWLKGLSPEILDRVASDYVAGRRLAQIIEDYSLASTHDVYRILDARGIPRRRFLNKPGGSRQRQPRSSSTP